MSKLADISVFENLQAAQHGSMGLSGIGVFNETAVKNGMDEEEDNINDRMDELNYFIKAIFVNSRVEEKIREDMKDEARQLKTLLLQKNEQANAIQNDITKRIKEKGATMNDPYIVKGVVEEFIADNRRNPNFISAPVNIRNVLQED